LPAGALEPRTKGAVRANTTLVVVATDAALRKSQAQRLAVMAQDGLAHAIFPVHTPLDGDIVFAAATGRCTLADPPRDLLRIGAVAMQVVARATAPAVYGATALPRDTCPGWRNGLGTCNACPAIPKTIVATKRLATKAPSLRRPPSVKIGLIRVGGPGSLRRKA